MKFALDENGRRQEAQPGLSGKCPGCDHPMIAKCGEVRREHWAHQAGRHCDLWWENETEWHRGWKNHFPVDWQEVVHHADNGEKHIADVKTMHGSVIEFQHSYLTPEERRSRDAFYPKLVWVVDGTRRKTDGEQFLKALNAGASVGVNSPLRIVLANECALLREWAGSPAPIFFDFGGGKVVWWILAKRPSGLAYVAPFSSADFIALQMAGEFEELAKDLSKRIADYEANLRAQAQTEASRPLPGFERYMARRRWRRF